MSNVEDFTLDDVQNGLIEAAQAKGKRKRKGKSSRFSVKKNAGKARALRKDGKPRKFRPGTVALREIRKYQKTGDLLLPRLPFERVARELAQNATYGGEGVRFKRSAIDALQAASEEFITDVLGKAYKGALRDKRLTLLKKDLVRLAEQQVGGSGSANILRQAMHVVD